VYPGSREADGPAREAGDARPQDFGVAHHIEISTISGCFCVFRFITDASY
jgi:hypothetical protein